MFGEKHDLVHELPEYREQVHHLKSNNTRFAKLFDEYREVEHEVRRIEGGAEVSSDLYLDGRKKKRLHLKDQLHSMLQA